MSQQIEEKLRAGVEPLHLEVLNESHQHRVPEGAESHFKVIIVTAVFEGLSLVERHRKIHELLSQELQNGVHALSLRLFTPLEWGEREGSVTNSPLCPR